MRWTLAEAWLPVSAGLRHPWTTCCRLETTIARASWETFLSRIPPRAPAPMQPHEAAGESRGAVNQDAFGSGRGHVHGLPRHAVG